jgi:hypothetical protein
MPVHMAVVPPPAPRATPSCAQHTWVAALHVEPPHAMPPPLDPEPPLDADPASPLLDPEPPLDVELDTPLLDPDPPLDVEPDSPLLDPEPLPDVDPDSTPLDPEPLVEVEPDPPPDPEPLVDASSEGPTAGIRGVPSSSWLRAPHPIANKTATVESALLEFIEGVVIRSVRRERTFVTIGLLVPRGGQTDHARPAKDLGRRGSTLAATVEQVLLALLHEGCELVAIGSDD